MNPPLLAIVGPTGVGKTALSLALAAKLDGEIVSADSRQVYRYMDIGTAKPTLKQRSAVPHHLVDVVDPDQEYSLALFLNQARDAIGDIHARSRLPILVGGAGQYVWALLEGWHVPEVPPDPVLRGRLEERARREGVGSLYDELRKVNPSLADRTDGLNPRRVVRALEVSYAGDSEQVGAKTPPPYRVMTLGLAADRASLHRRIDLRVDAMLDAGWAGEVQALLDRGYDADLPSMSSLGYRELIQHLTGDVSLEEAVARIKSRTHGFARGQMGWFRPADSRIRWFDADGGPDPALQAVERWLQGAGGPGGRGALC